MNNETTASQPKVYICSDNECQWEWEQQDAGAAPPLCGCCAKQMVIKSSGQADSQTKSIGDDAQFQVALKEFEASVKNGSPNVRAKRNLIKLIDSRAPAALASATIQAAPDLRKLLRVDFYPDTGEYESSADGGYVKFADVEALLAATIQEPVMVAEPVDESRYRTDMPEPGPKEHFDDTAVQHFADAMKAKMAASRAKGRYGWIDCHPDELRRMMIGHIAKGDPVDVANFCMMLWSLGHSAAPMVADPAGVAEGWQLVPKIPTPEMIYNTASFDLEGEDDQNNACDIIYRAMLAAAPEPEAATVKAVPSEALTEKEIDFVQRVLAAPGYKLNGEGESTDYSEGAEINALWQRPEDRNMVIVTGSYKWRTNPRLVQAVSEAARRVIANFAAPLADKTGGGE